MPNLWEIIEAAGNDEYSDVTKELFGELVHSDNQDDVDRAMAALEASGGYENLGD